MPDLIMLKVASPRTYVIKVASMRGNHPVIIAVSIWNPDPLFKTLNIAFHDLTPCMLSLA